MEDCHEQKHSSSTPDEEMLNIEGKSDFGSLWLCIPFAIRVLALLFAFQLGKIAGYCHWLLAREAAHDCSLHAR
jgi:hypothetical protein